MRKVSHVLTKNILVIQSEENILTLYFFNTYLHLLSCYLLMCFVRMFQWECSRERFDLAKITKHLHQSKWQIWSFDKCQECSESKIKKNYYSLCLTKRMINDHKNQVMAGTERTFSVNSFHVFSPSIKWSQIFSVWNEFQQLFFSLISKTYISYK